MKKNLLFVVVLVAAVALLASCKKKEISMTPETTKVSGSLAACFEVVDEPVKVALKDGKLDEMESVWSVKLRRTDAPLPFKEDSEIAAYGVFRTDGKAYYHVGFGLKVTDAGGNTVQDAKANASGFEGPYSYEDIDALFELNPGETGEIRWTVDSRCQDAKEPLKFTISSAYDLVEGAESEEAVSSASSITVENVILPAKLKDKVEVIKVSKKVNTTKSPAVSITFKLLSTVDTKPLVGRCKQMWIYGIGQDEDGADVEELLPGYREWRSGDSNGSMFKEFLESEPGTTITLQFTGNTSPTVRADLERVTKFKLQLTKM